MKTLISGLALICAANGANAAMLCLKGADSNRSIKGSSALTITISDNFTNTLMRNDVVPVIDKVASYSLKDKAGNVVQMLETDGAGVPTAVFSMDAGNYATGLKFNSERTRAMAAEGMNGIGASKGHFDCYDLVDPKVESQGQVRADKYDVVQITGDDAQKLWTSMSDVKIEDMGEAGDSSILFRQGQHMTCYQTPVKKGYFGGKKLNYNCQIQLIGHAGVIGRGPFPWESDPASPASSVEEAVREDAWRGTRD